MPEIIFPKFQGRKTEMAYGLEEVNRRFLTGVMAKHHKVKRPYHILFLAKNGLNGKLCVHVQVQFEEPPRLLGTLCYKVDNRVGTLTRLWVLPLDVPFPDHLVSEHADSPESRLGAWNINDDSKDLPIVYGVN
jgi:hypothetical protein